MNRTRTGVGLALLGLVGFGSPAAAAGELGWEAVEPAQLEQTRARGAESQTAEVSAELNGGTVTAQTGENTISQAAFVGASGVINVTQVSGNQVIAQNNVVVNINWGIGLTP